MPTAEVARQAMQTAQEWWERRAYSVEDVSGYGMGYDLTVRRGDDGYYVEVKGLTRPGPLTLTENEWRVAQETGCRYCLMVVVLGEGSPYLIWDPATRLGQQVESVPRQHTEYQISLSAWRNACSEGDEAPR